MERNIKNAWAAIPFDNIKELQEYVPKMVNADASTNSSEDHLHTLLMCAAAHGSINCLEYLLSNGANPNKKNFVGMTALHWAAYSAREECVKKLLNAGAKIEAKTEDGKTPFHIAASRGHLQFIVFLKELGCDINAVTSEGWTGMHFAIIGNHQNVAKYLLDQKIDFMGPDIFGKTLISLVEEYQRTWFKVNV